MKLVVLALLLDIRAQGVERLEECSGSETMLKPCENKECPKDVSVDCAWGEWSDWGPCSCFGLQDRHRDIKTSSNEFGEACKGAKVETKKCMPDCAKNAHPRDCELTEWSTWGECTKSCNVGQQFRERSVKTQVRQDGKPCNDDLKETRSCHKHGCDNPENCVLSPWTEWTQCTKSCNGGQSERTRKIETPAKDFGTLCDDVTHEIKGCGKEDCSGAINCQWDQWQSWSACSATCDGGERSRSRLISTAPRGGGKLCEANDMSEVGACETQPCQQPVDCKIGDWTAWSACTCDCNGVQSRTRHITTYPSEGGKPCSGSLKIIKACNTGPSNCVELVGTDQQEPPQDCILSPFSDWNTCTKTCGGGQQERSREIKQQANARGKACDDVLDEVRPCGTETCPAPVTKGTTEPAVDCVWEDWGAWNECTVSCGGGSHQRVRDIRVAANEHGHPCDSRSAVDVEGCNMHACDSVNCTWGAWGSWGACTCTGLRERHRNIGKHSVNGGDTCEGAKVITQSCSPDCDVESVNCELSQWSEWSKCSADCGGGESYRTRDIAKEEKGGGRTCDGFLKEIAACGQSTCEKSINCKISPWSEWTACTATCDGGQSFRHRNILTFSAYGGKACTDELKEIKGCGTDTCNASTDCKWGGWTTWSACTKTCGGGQKTRDRSVKIAPRAQGKLCDAITKAEVGSCNTQACGHNGCINAEWGPWHDWGMCSASCGRGYQSRERIIAQRANHCGKGVTGNLTEYKECNLRACNDAAVPCAFDNWSEWGACSCSCNGIRDRSRHIREYSKNGGKACDGPLKEVGGCNEGECGRADPVDCKLGPWRPWGSCTTECGGGVQTRRRIVEVPPENGGKPCVGTIKMVQGCNYRPCSRASDCLWGEWGKWDTCSVDCGGGQRTRYRHIKRMPSHDGKACDSHANVQIEGCNTQSCGQVMYCSWSSWGKWTGCSTTCGPGQSVRRRQLVETPHKPDDGIMDSGILAQIDAALEDDTKVQFSTEDASTVFLVSVVTTSLSLAAVVQIYRRFTTRHIPVAAADTS